LLNHPEGTGRLNGWGASGEQRLNAVTGKVERAQLGFQPVKRIHESQS
jgi:hypothetical protein